VLASLILQLLVGVVFGHMYDTRISMATGYLVATGQDPYIAQNLTTVFNNQAFQGMTSIGYPPPWPLILGVIYLISYNLTHNLLIYNLAIKLPIIAANLGLAYLVREVLKRQSASQNIADKAWLFLLFNPFLLYFNTAWGQFDSLVTVLTLFALVLISEHHIEASAAVLGLAVALKPTPVPVILAILAYLWGTEWKWLARYITTLVVSLFVFCVLPFFVFHWSASPILKGWNAQFSVSGGMSLTTLYELVKDTYILPGYGWLLGFLWLPAVLIGALFLRRGEHGLVELIKNSLRLTLIFFLTRTWLSEQNLTLILPLALILVSLGELPRLCLSVVWVLPLIFTIFNTSPAQLLFPILPGLMVKLLTWADTYRTLRLVIRMLLVIPWQWAGWWMVVYKPGKKVAALA
jgi:Gpi18-like mannosyltransferase